jgi:hypothetical protein
MLKCLFYFAFRLHSHRPTIGWRAPLPEKIARSNIGGTAINVNCDYRVKVQMF